ncbi:hypothetical protein X777_01027 [Ooceraea biroi]|uniref:Uncharacterized protein n=1 Tax=Ooceraea biroi TaxID=2015173 RepID=A0A026VVK1_OOCBI|nr:hypothetical protein X777_01027 [Ooceraea biroi]
MPQRNVRRSHRIVSLRRDESSTEGLRQKLTYPWRNPIDLKARHEELDVRLSRSQIRISSST